MKWFSKLHDFQSSDLGRTQYVWSGPTIWPPSNDFSNDKKGDDWQIEEEPTTCEAGDFCQNLYQV